MATYDNLVLFGKIEGAGDTPLKKEMREKGKAGYRIVSVNGPSPNDSFYVVMEKEQA